MSNRFTAQTERPKRKLRVGPPEVHSFTTGDQVQLRLTHYRGGTKGPLILAHSLGVSSLIFAIDTIETNLLEYLYAHGYDIWLLDYRNSIDLPVSQTQYTADDIATQDYPAAVQKVRELTGADSVQVFAHGFGSTTFTMAMLAGLQDVRSAVCSQVMIYQITPGMSRFTSMLHAPTLLHTLGVKTLATVNTDPGGLNRLYDAALKLLPVEAEERCSSPICRRVDFIYGPLYEHDQLNDATHAALAEMFGPVPISILENLALFTRVGHIVNTRGEDVYLSHTDRLAIPLRMLHGAENHSVLPVSTEKTYRLLCERNNSELYSYRIIPNYGEMDCIFGKNAASDVYPLILEHLEATNA